LKKQKQFNAESAESAEEEEEVVLKKQKRFHRRDRRGQGITILPP